MRFVLLAWTLTVLVVAGCGSPTPSTVSAAPKVGDEAVVRAGDDPIVVIAATEEDYEALVKAGVANDTLAFAEMVESGRAFEVVAGTKVLVIDNGSFRRQIRVLEGSEFGRSGWVPTEFVHRE